MILMVLVLEGSVEARLRQGEIGLDRSAITKFVTTSVCRR